MGSDPTPMTPELRKQLAALARNKKRRRTEFSRTMPTQWSPQNVVNPEAGFGFSDESAWCMVADLLDGQTLFTPKMLDVPAGATGYTCLVPLEVGKPPLYIKIQLEAGVVVGRSFHYSERSPVVKQVQ